jgi:glutathione reductase (NADPH)
MTHPYDLIVIGAGPGGLSAAKRAAHYDANVLIVEREHLGGVCVNRGCIPKKLMVYAADFAKSFEDARCYGWQMQPPTLNWQQFLAVRNQEVERIRHAQAEALTKAGVEIVRGQARLIDAHTIAVADRQFTSESILLAVGGKPTKLDIPGVEYAITSCEMFELAQIPRRLAIIGGGYIGVEFASIFRGLGGEVTLMNLEECLLPGFDYDLRRAVRDGLVQRGVTSLCGTTVKAIAPTSNGLQLTLSGDHSDTITVDTVLCAVGRSPNLEGLGLGRVGVTVTDGAIAVDDYSCTSQPNIYAVGDCTDRIPLTPVARAEGYAVAETLFGSAPCQPNDTFIPTAVFSRPEMATAGMTESQARDHYGDAAVQIRCMQFQPLVDRLGQGDMRSLFKLVIHQQTQRLLGIHLLGRHAAEIIQGFALALRQDITQFDLETMIGIHPSSAEELFD